MSHTEPDPSQSTEMFRAFVERGPRDRDNEYEATPQRRVPPVAVMAIVAIVVVLAVAVWLVF
jgi:hypothetical protein